METPYFNAVIITKLTYGLETVQFTEYVGNRLDVFQMKGLRKILNIPPTFIDRSWTNQKVSEEVNAKAGEGTTLDDTVIKIRPVTQFIENAALRPCHPRES